MVKLTGLVKFIRVYDDIGILSNEANPANGNLSGLAQRAESTKTSASIGFITKRVSFNLVISTESFTYNMTVFADASIIASASEEPSAARCPSTRISVIPPLTTGYGISFSIAHEVANKKRNKQKPSTTFL